MRLDELQGASKVIGMFNLRHYYYLFIYFVIKEAFLVAMRSEMSLTGVMRQWLNLQFYISEDQSSYIFRVRTHLPLYHLSLFQP